MKEIDMEEKER